MKQPPASPSTYNVVVQRASTSACSMFVQKGRLSLRGTAGVALQQCACLVMSKYAQWLVTTLRR